MYNEHQQQISAYALRKPDQFADVLRFVILTIRQQLTNAVDQARGESELNAFGFKLKALAEIDRDHEKIFNDCNMLYDIGDFAGVLERLTRVHGLGLVKAGFVCQLVYGFGGCIDSHNLSIYNISVGEVRMTASKNHNTRLAKCKAYLELCEKLGGSEKLWDDWCKHVAREQPYLYNSGYEVSELHIVGICKGY